MKPQLLVDTACHTGESPVWHPEEQCLYWVDIPNGRLFRYTPFTGASEEFDQGQAIGGLTIQQDGSLLLFMAHGAVRRWRDGVLLDTIIDEIAEERDGRFNDVIADPEGRVFCGTMGTAAHPSRLYRLDTDGSIHLLLENLGLANGMAFSPDLRQFYLTDSKTREIILFDYEQSSGNIGNSRPFVTVPEGEGVPDGLTVDADGYIWSARWDGECLVRYTPDGQEDLRIAFPVKKVTSLTFGGPEYSDIYVTTSGGQQKATDGPEAGALFRLKAGIRGRPEFLSRVKL